MVLRGERARRVENVREQRPAGEGMQHLGQLGAHALAQAGRENDDVERHALDSSGNSTLLSEALASAFARVALANIAREFPRKLDHLLKAEEAPRSERERHPAFYGSFDWHSAVHMHWTLVRVLHLYPMLPENGQIAAALDRHLSADAIAAELAYLKAQRTFERPYGWAWLLELQAEALRARARWSRALAPLAKEISSRMSAFVAESPYPVRAGTHGNTAFASILALDYARASKDLPLEMEIRKAARRWYGS